MTNKKKTAIVLMLLLVLSVAIAAVVSIRHTPTTKKEAAKEAAETQTKSPEEILPNQIRINEIAEEAEAALQHYAAIRTKSQRVLQLRNTVCDQRGHEKDACLPQVMHILSGDDNNEVEKSLVALANRGVTIVIQSQPGLARIESRPDITDVGPIYQDEQGNIIIPTNSDYQDIHDYLRLP